MLFADLNEVKAVLDIDTDDTVEDKKLLLYGEWASELIEDFLGRKGRLQLRSRTEYYGGTGTQRLLLKSRPAYTTPALQVYVDEAGYFASPAGAFDPVSSLLTYGNDYALALDWDSDDDGVEDASRSGILVRVDDYWPRPQVRQRGLLAAFLGNSHGNVKVVYTAGWTLDSLPAPFRLAANALVAAIAYLFPLGKELAGEGYEERSVSIAANQRDYLMGLVKPMLFQYRNWHW